MNSNVNILLYVEDSVLRSRLQKNLLLQEYFVEGVEFKEDVLGVAKSQFFNLILLEAKEVTDEIFALVKSLRNQYPNKKQTIVLLTPPPNRDLVGKFLREGIDSWIELPVDRDSLLQGVDSALKSQENLETTEVTDGWIEFRLKSTLEILHSVNRFISGLLQVSGLAEDEIRKFAFAINEMLINGMEHGNQFDKDKKVKCSYVLFSDKVIIKIEDQGTGFSVQEVPDPIKDPLGVATKRQKEGKRPGGYGLAMTRKYVDVEYSNQGNIVMLTKYFHSEAEKSFG